MKRWPEVTSPEAIPSMSNGTISATSCGVPSVQRMPRSGRIQRSASGFVEAAPQRIDFGQGLLGRPAGPFDHRDIERALLRVLFDRRVLDPREAGAFEEAPDRRLGRADARAFALLAPVGLSGGQA